MQGKDKGKKAEKRELVEAERSSTEKVGVFLLKHTLSARPGLHMTDSF